MLETGLPSLYLPQGFPLEPVEVTQSLLKPFPKHRGVNAFSATGSEDLMITCPNLSSFRGTILRKFYLVAQKSSVGLSLLPEKSNQ